MIYNLVFEEFLHSLDPPESSSQNNVPADSFKAIFRDVWKNSQEGMSNVDFFLLGVAVEGGEVQSIRDPLDSMLAF